MLSEKKFSRECVRVCVKETRLMKNIEADMQAVFDDVWAKQFGDGDLYSCR